MLGLIPLIPSTSALFHLFLMLEHLLMMVSESIKCLDFYKL